MENNEEDAVSSEFERRMTAGQDVPAGADTFSSEETEIDTSHLDLRDEIAGDEVELLPPEEENEAKEMNVGTIFAKITASFVKI